MTQHRSALSSLVLGMLLLPALAGAQPLYPEPDYPDPDAFELNWSARLVNGFGASVGSLEQHFIMETALRADFLWGKPGDQHFRLGPAVDLRTATFHTIEAGAGGTILFPVFRGYPITLTTTVGYALRKSDLGGNGFFVSNTFAWGYRSFNYHSRYGIAFNGFISTRHHLDARHALEVTGGIELDVELAIGIPARVLIQLFRKGDPDEPEEEEAEEEPEADEASEGFGPRRVPPSRAIAF